MTRARLRRITAPAALFGAILFLALTAPASDPPHWTGQRFKMTCGDGQDAQNFGCHAVHNSQGLTRVTGNANLCQSCHVTGGLASDLAIATVDKASPADGTGLHHGWDVGATNVSVGAQPPLDAEMLARLSSGNLMCSTCHDQHAAIAASGGLSRISRIRKTLAAATPGTGTIVLPASVPARGSFNGAQSFWYVVEITTTGTQATALFRWSRVDDVGSTIVASNVLAGASVALENGVALSFTSGTFTAGEIWELSASYPFHRIPLDSGDNVTGARFCRDCHRSWTHDTTSVRTWDGSQKSHPVGVTIPVGSAYRPAPLDGNGSANDSNAGNDLRLDTTNRVQCLTCHRTHDAPSNTSAVLP